MCIDWKVKTKLYLNEFTGLQIQQSILFLCSSNEQLEFEVIKNYNNRNN